MLRRALMVLSLVVLSALSGARAQKTRAPILDDRNVVASVPYTEIKDGLTVSIPENTKRIALLIGNDTYDKIGVDPRRPTANHLTPLTTACSDVQAVARQLASIGWAKNELLVACNQTNQEISTAVGQLVSTAPLEPSHPRLMLLYLAGHGMQVDGRNYFFGVNSLLDYERTARRAIAAAGSNSTGKIFGPVDAVDLYYDLSRFENEQSLAFPILVIVDACRDAPFLKLVDGAVPPAIANTDEGRKYIELIKRVISDAQPARALPDGEEIYYGTKVGDTVVETPGASRLAAAMSNGLAANIVIRKQLFDFKKSIEDDNNNMALRDRQYLSKEGDIYYGAEDWCFFGCPAMNTASRETPRARAQFASLSRWSSVPGQSVPASPAPRQPMGQVTVVGRYKTDTPRKVLLDVFWCSGDNDADQRRDRAKEFGARLGAKLAFANKRAGQSEIYAIRLRELTAADNAIPGYQKNFDAFYFDPYQIEPDESRLADIWLRPLLPNFTSRTTGVASKDYVSVFFCKGAFSGKAAPTVYFQVATSADLPVASKAMSAMRKSVGDVFVFTEAEIMLERKDAARIRYPAATEVRFSDLQVKPQANEVATVIGQLLGRPTAAKCIDKCQRPEKSHNIEVWLGPNEAGLTWRH